MFKSKCCFFAESNQTLNNPCALQLISSPVQTVTVRRGLHAKTCLQSNSPKTVQVSDEFQSCLLVGRISLEVMTLNPICESVETSEGVPLTVTGVAQCKVMTEPELLATACEQFLGKSVDHIKSVILQTLEGHLRAILGEFFSMYGR